MSRIDCTGAELNSLNELDSVTNAPVGGTHVFESSSSQSRSGTRSWHANRQNVTTGGNLFGQIDVSGAPTSFTAKFSFRVESSEDGTRSNLFRINFGAGEGIACYIGYSVIPSPHNTLVFQQFNAVVSGAANSVDENFSLGRWHEGMIRVTVPGAGDTNFTFQYDGGTEQTSNDGDRFLTQGVSSVQFGLPASEQITTPDPNASNVEVFIDDIILDNSNANINKGRFLSFHQPNADRATINWGTVGGAGAEYTRTTDNDDATAIRASGAAAANEEFEMTNTSGTWPSTFRPFFFYGSCRIGNALDTVAFTYRMRDSADASQGSVSVAASAVLDTKRSVLLIDSSAESQSDMDGWYYRFEKAAGIATDQCTVEEVWSYIEVEADVTPNDSLSISETITRLNATVKTSETLTASEANSIRNTLKVSDSASINEALKINVDVSLSDAFTASEESKKTVFVEEGGGGGTIFVLNE